MGNGIYVDSTSAITFSGAPGIERTLYSKDIVGGGNGVGDGNCAKWHGVIVRNTSPATYLKFLLGGVNLFPSGLALPGTCVVDIDIWRAGTTQAFVDARIVDMSTGEVQQVYGGGIAGQVDGLNWSVQQTLAVRGYSDVQDGACVRRCGLVK